MFSVFFPLSVSGHSCSAGHGCDAPSGSLSDTACLCGCRLSGRAQYLQGKGRRTGYSAQGRAEKQDSEGKDRMFSGGSDRGGLNVPVSGKPVSYRQLLDCGSARGPTGYNENYEGGEIS